MSPVNQSVANQKHVVVVGGSVAGLGAALVLSSEGHRVTVLEKDATPLPGSPLEAFESWDRRGSPQTRHSHAFLARLHGILVRRSPELLAKLLEHGAEELCFTDMARHALQQEDLEFREGDEDIKLLACRRITFEWALRRFVLDTGLVTFRDGVEVVGLVAADTSSTVPHVTGVRLVRDGVLETLAADLVLDASGRRSILRKWLAEIGGGPLEKDSEPCGIFYCSRFYRTLDGAEKPELGGVMGSDLGYLKYGVFPGDAGIFSITLCASPDDDELRKILKTEAFEAATSALPATQPWIDPKVSVPISDVHAMGNLKNTRSFFVKDGAPLATGIFPIGDALIHSNPLNGRGCTLAFVNAELVAQALTEHGDDPMEFALALDAAIEREIVPWYQATLQQDRDAIEVNRAQRAGEDPYAYQREDNTVDMRKYMRSLLRDGLLPAMKEDLSLLRVFMRVFNLLEAPSELMKDPEILQRVLASYEKRDEREPVVNGPSRAEMIEHLAAAAS